MNSSFDDSGNFSSSDSTTLENIASGCPLEGGIGVYIARGMMDYSDYDESKSCDTITSRQYQDSRDQDIRSKSFEVRPNPNGGSFSLVLPNDSSYDLNIYSLTGHLVNQYFSISHDNVIEINNPGIFVVLARDLEDGIIYFSRVVVTNNE